MHTATLKRIKRLKCNVPCKIFREQNVSLVRTCFFIRSQKKEKKKKKKKNRKKARFLLIFH